MGARRSARPGTDAQASGNRPAGDWDRFDDRIAADAGRRHHCFHAGVNGQPKRELAEKSSAMTEMMRAAEEKKSESL
nr:MAG TPA: hypothetical protein [Caudoviricetes sp.]